jgi:hypothetical protein
MVVVGESAVTKKQFVGSSDAISKGSEKFSLSSIQSLFYSVLCAYVFFSS